MAKDDYHVIVYQILAYLYQCLKTGKDVDSKMLSVDSDYFLVNEQKIHRRGGIGRILFTICNETA